MKKISLFFLFIVFFSVPLSVSAQGLLPSTELDDDACEALSAQSFTEVVNAINSEERTYKFDSQSHPTIPEVDKDGNFVYKTATEEISDMDDVLGCALRTGRFRLSMLPYMALYGIKFFSALAGVLSVLYIVIGGYHFVIGSLTEEKEKGKKTVLYALIGFALSMLAYTIVNLVQIAVSS